jgi:hypothetical protein
LSKQKTILQNFGTALSRQQMKVILGGTQTLEESDGPVGVSCKCKNEKSAGMAIGDTCERWCSTDNSYGGKQACS